MQKVEAHQHAEDSFFHGISEVYRSIKQHNATVERIFDVLESFGHQAYDVAVKYGPVCVDVLSKGAAKLCEFSFPPFDNLSLVFQNFKKSSDELLYSGGCGFFKSDFGRLTIKSLDTCTYSCERLLKRLELTTKSTVTMLRSKLPVNAVNQSTEDSIASQSMDGKPTESEPVPKIEPSPVGDHLFLSSEAESSAAESEKDPFAEFKSSSNLTIVYENVTGLEKAFVLLYDVLVLCPVNAIVAFIRFVRNIVLDFEECCHASKVNVTNAGRHVKSSSLNKTTLKNRLKTLYSDISDPMKPIEPVIRIESKECAALSSDSKGGLLSSLVDSVNIYWEESDPDYVPSNQSSDSSTESGESESDISVEEVNGMLSIKEEKPEKMENKSPVKSKDKDV